TEFWDTDLVGTVIPDSAHVSGILLEYKGTAQLAPRSAADVVKLVLYVPSDDASITDLQVDGTTVTGFTPAQLSYSVVLPGGTATPPAVTVVTTHDSAIVSVTDATDLAGDEAARTTTVLITAEDEVATKTYTVIFSLAVGVENLVGASMEIFPVPANNELFVKSAESLSELRVISITGSTIQVVELSGEKSAQLNISELESGVYFLKLSGESSTQILRFVKN
ncbi:MAG: T9SS type A sorting domain-containing protein, partial [Gammaproteobacteria bacterium]|nr:T9SS type A sorting domain-containing protein [Gammaproteobacteria bacterium]